MSSGPTKSTYINAFNTHLFEFLDDIIALFPQSSDLRVAKNTLSLLQKGNSSAIIRVWYSQVVSPYKEEIEHGNIDFFIDKDYSSDLSSMSNNGRVMQVIDQFREPIRNMSHTSKAHTIKYIQNLSRLSQLYHQQAAYHKIWIDKLLGLYLFSFHEPCILRERAK